MTSDLDDLLSDLSSAQDRNRTPLDRYRDFRAVFLGSDQGKRVLHDILGWCHMWHSSVVRGDSYMTHVNEGERRIGLKLVATVHIEPPDKPTAQNREAKEG